METQTTTSSLLLHPHSPPHPPPPPWQSPILIPLSLLTSSTSLTITITPPPRFTSRLLAIRSRKFDFSGFNFDDDYGINGGGAGFDRTRRRGRRRRKSSSDTRSKQRRRWWSDDDDDEEEDSNVLDESNRSGALEQVIDGVWIFKVLRSYGWFLPAILASLLLASGPKAFLTAFSLPLGISLLILAFNKLGEWLNGNPKPRRRRKTRSPFSVETDDLVEEEDDQEEESKPGKRNKKRDRYRSWAAGGNGSVHKGDTGSRASASSFGGWDELIGEAEVEKEGSSPEMARLEKLVEETKMNNRSLKERDVPLLVKLLVSLFPFLGSWTNLLR